jgi:hypothetical protein
MSDEYQYYSSLITACFATHSSLWATHYSSLITHHCYWSHSMPPKTYLALGNDGAQSPSTSMVCHPT